MKCSGPWWNIFGEIDAGGHWFPATIAIARLRATKSAIMFSAPQEWWLRFRCKNLYCTCSVVAVGVVAGSVESECSCSVSS